MNFFDKLKISIKHKWLDYYELNRYWLVKAGSWVNTPDQGSRPDSLVIIGAVVALEPRLVEFMPAFCDLKNDAGEIVRILELNFDPRIELKRRTAELAASEQTETTFVLTDLDTEYLNKIREETKT
jgi:hypothetical protein